VIRGAATLAALLLASPSWAVASGNARHGPIFGGVALLNGNASHCLQGVAADRVALIACRDRCEPIPWQLDERRDDGRLVVDQGPFPNPEDPPNVIDDNDEIRWLVEDAGRQILPGEQPRDSPCRLEICLRERETGYRAWVYAFVWPTMAPRSERSYVRYDPVRDVIEGQRVALGFGGATPQYMALRGEGGSWGANLLDRLKIRVSAWFLGLIPVSRDEADLTTEFVGWHEGPIRIVRRQRQWVYVGWGIRSPTFGSYTYFYRDSAELPVSLYLNFPPTYFFKRIKIQAVLDLRDLSGWQLLADGLGAPLTIGALKKEDLRLLERLNSSWLALVGPDATLVQFLDVSPSMSSLERKLLYRETSKAREPEAVPGELPGVGHRLSHWNDVSGGWHWFSARNYALPAGYDPRRLVRELQREVTLEIRELPSLRDMPGA